MKIGRIRFAAFVACIAAAAPNAAAADSNIPEQVVVTSPARGNAFIVDSDEIDALHAPTAADALNDTVPSVFVSDTESNPFQLDVYFRGFDASPVLGTPEGLAVYQNGSRINEPFGDTVLWDLVPSFAIERIDVVPGSDPVLGLNALGGAITLDMKTGFDASGETLDLSAGSFDRATGVAQFARQYGNVAVYIGADAEHDGGWRRFSPSDLGQFYADASMHEARFSAGISLTLAADWLTENAAVPVQDTPVAAFSTPGRSQDRLVYLQTHGEYDWDARLVSRGTFYVRMTQIDTQNGEPSGFLPCSSNATLLCSPPDLADPLANIGGATVPSSVVGNGLIGVQTTITNGTGATFESEYSGSVFGFDNVVRAGATFDYANARFNSSTELGYLTYQPGGVTAVKDGLALGGTAWNIRLRTTNSNTGVYAEDTLDLAPAVSLRLSGRFNFSEIRLDDELGNALTGTHGYSKFNPAARLSWRFANAASVYVDYGQSSRTPTAAELSCANPVQPCLFPLSFISDPRLHQVGAQTIELGASGNAQWENVAFDWQGDVYETRNNNDIIFVGTGNSIASGYFDNVGATERQGAEAALHAVWSQFDMRASYGLVLATFRTPFIIPSAFNPGANANGDIFVRPGDFMPNIPRHTAKFEIGWQATNALHLGAEAHAESSSYFRGDEANLQKPLPGYITFDADADYRIAEGVSLYLTAANLFDRHYATYALYGDPTGNGALPQFSNPRFVVPAAPTAVAGGLRVMF